MAVVFYDDFNRADGAPGSAWTVQSGNWAIDGNTLKVALGGFIHCNTMPAGPDVAAFITVPAYGGTVKSYQIRLRQSADYTSYVQATFVLSATSIAVTISEATGSSPVNLAARTAGYSPAVTTYLMVTAVGNLISANVDSGEWLTVRSDVTPFVGTCALGTVYANTVLDDYWQYDLASDAGSVDAIPVEETPGTITVTLHNAASDWTPGDPGAPTFTCRAGAIWGQEVTDANTAVLEYVAPVLKTVEVFNDPYNGVDYYLELSNPPGSTGTGGSGGGLTSTQEATLADLATYLGAYQTGTSGISGFWLKLGAISVLAGSAYSESDGSSLGDTMAAILSSTEGLAVIKNRIDLIRSAQDALTSEDTYSLPSVQEAIRGSGARDLTAVYNLIAALAPADSTDVTEILNAIAAIRTANLWSLDSVKTWIDAIETGSNQDVLDELARIRTANNWSLGTLYDLINGIDIPDNATALQNIQDAVDAIPTDPIRSLQSVLDAIAAVRGSGTPDIAAVLTAIDAIPTNPITDLSGVLTAVGNLATSVSDKYTALLNAINALAAPEPTPTAPVWPGIDNVTLGDPISLDTVFSFTGACDGVIVAITGAPTNTSVYNWDDLTQYPRAGYISFKSDGGAYEDPMPFTFPSHMLTPAHMSRAAGFTGRARGGITGSVTPWTINAS